MVVCCEVDVPYWARRLWCWRVIVLVIILDLLRQAYTGCKVAAQWYTLTNERARRATS